MSYQLRADEIMEALQRAQHPRAARLIEFVEAAVNLAAWDLAEHLGVKCGVGDFQGVAFAGLCVPFYPGSDGQPIPEALQGFDSADEWEDGTEPGECGQCEGTGTIAGGLSGDSEDEECPICDGSGNLAGGEG